ncbi:tyrosine-type recombinase/integrase [Streptomyces sp. QTS137]
MRVQQRQQEDGSTLVELVDGDGVPVEVVAGFLRFLGARDCSPNTLVPYAYDLRHLWRFFASEDLSWERFGPPDAIALLEYLPSVPSRRPRRRMTLSVVTMDADGPATKLAASTVDRILAAVSSFYEYVILAGLLERANPIEKRPDPAPQRGSDRHRPFMGRASRQRPVRRAVRAKTVQRVPRPLGDDQVELLLSQLRGLRDKAIMLLMLHGGLRPGEVLALHLDDLAYGRRRVVVRHRDGHPKGARSKSGSSGSSTCTRRRPWPRSAPTLRDHCLGWCPLTAKSVVCSPLTWSD